MGNYENNAAKLSKKEKVCGHRHHPTLPSLNDPDNILSILPFLVSCLLYLLRSESDLPLGRNSSILRMSSGVFDSYDVNDDVRARVFVVTSLGLLTLMMIMSTCANVLRTQNNLIVYPMSKLDSCIHGEHVIIL